MADREGLVERVVADIRPPLGVAALPLVKAEELLVGSDGAPARGSDPVSAEPDDEAGDGLGEGVESGAGALETLSGAVETLDAALDAAEKAATTPATPDWATAS